MTTTSRTTIRIRGIANSVSNENFHDICSQSSDVSEEKSLFSWMNLVSWTTLFSWVISYKSPSPPEILQTSLAMHEGERTGTVTFKDNDGKAKALRGVYPKAWVVDDEFDDVTILYSPEDIESVDLDICAVHGLQGNGFDAWQAESCSKPSMWLRDLLPFTPPFERSRIMTFGYSSQVWDRTNVDGIRDWADHLLIQLGMVRSDPAEKNRPLILVCHSLGGIVAREAMIRLAAHPEKYSGLGIQKCGLLFLGTPHSGTDQADWNFFLTGVAALVGIRTDILGILSSFNGFGVESKEAFKSIKPCPPHYYVCETRTIKVATAGWPISQSVSIS